MHGTCPCCCRETLPHADECTWEKDAPEDAAAWAAKQQAEPRLKLFVWTQFSPGYSPGLAFAVAANKAEAKAAVEAVYGRVTEWGKCRVHKIESGRAEAVGGGA